MAVYQTTVAASSTSNSEVFLQSHPLTTNTVTWTGNTTNWATGETVEQRVEVLEDLVDELRGQLEICLEAIDVLVRER